MNPKKLMLPQFKAPFPSTEQLAKQLLWTSLGEHSLCTDGQLRGSEQGGSGPRTSRGKHAYEWWDPQQQWVDIGVTRKADEPRLGHPSGAAGTVIPGWGGQGISYRLLGATRGFPNPKVTFLFQDRSHSQLKQCPHMKCLLSTSLHPDNYRILTFEHFLLELLRFLNLSNH